MPHSPGDLRLQASLLILFSCSVLTGMLGLLAHTFPLLPIPASLILTKAGSLSIALGGVAMTALLLRLQFCRLLCGALLLVLGAYSIGYNQLADPSASGLSLLSDYPRLQPLPAAAVILLAGITLLGVCSVLGRLYGLLVGCFGVLLGTYVVIVHIQQGTYTGAGHFVSGFTPVAGLFCLGFGAVLLILARRRPGESSLLSQSAIAAGILGVAGTFLLSVAATWGTHSERHQAAHSAVLHHAGLLESSLESSTRLIERLVVRWATLDFEVPEVLQQADVERYFADTPALKSMLVLSESGLPLWQKNRTASERLWLANQIENSSVQGWAQTDGDKKPASKWLLPDLNRPLAALLLVTPEGSSDERFIAVFNLAELLEEVSAHNQHAFEIRLKATTSVVAGTTFAATHHQSQEIYAHSLLGMADGPTLVLSAVAGPPSVLTLSGALPPALFAFGLMVSYLLIMGRGLLGVQKLQARELSVAEQRFRSLFSHSPDAVLAFDCQGQYQSLNKIAVDIVGLSEAEIQGVNYRDILTPEAVSVADFNTFDSAFQSTLTGRPQIFEIRFLNAQHQFRNYECAFIPIVVEAEVVGVFAVVKDVTERLESQENQRILQKSLESSNNAVVVVDVRSEEMPAVFVNPAFTAMTGYTEREMIGHSTTKLTGPETDPEDIEQIQKAIKSGLSTSLVLKSYRKDGTPFWNQISLAAVKDDEGKVTHFTAIMSDISEKKAQEKRLAHQATHDALTGLGNRALFEDRLEHDFELARRHNQLLAVLFIDLDEFKPINDALGHKIGDNLLISVTRILQAAIRPTDTLARFGGDEFVLLLPDISSIQEAEDVAERILVDIAQPHRVGSHELYISASIGISVLDEDLQQPERLLQQADMAMYKAKQQGRDTYEIYSGDLDTKLSRRVALRNDLQEAIKFNQLYLHYQPQVDESGRFCGLEALVRWKHPDKGVIPPADFIPLAEETGQIVHLGKWVITQACSDARKLAEAGILQGRMAVNLSPLQFHRPGFLAALRHILYKTGLSASLLELELTEGILMKDSEGAIDILNALTGMGIATSIDDFGTGYSSLSYLKDLPVDTIKIDRSFVNMIATNKKDAAVCAGAIAMAQEMDLKIVAEGVETEAQLNCLKGYGCKAFQGYYFARPMPFDELVKWIEGNRTD